MVVSEGVYCWVRFQYDVIPPVMGVYLLAVSQERCPDCELFLDEYNLVYVSMSLRGRTFAPDGWL